MNRTDTVILIILISLLLAELLINKVWLHAFYGLIFVLLVIAFQIIVGTRKRENTQVVSLLKQKKGLLVSGFLITAAALDLLINKSITTTFSLLLLLLLLLCFQFFFSRCTSENVGGGRSGQSLCLDNHSEANEQKAEALQPKKD